MDDRQKTLAAVAIIIGFIAIVIVIIGVVISGRKIISPIPDAGAIRIIFVTPTPVRSASSSAGTPVPKP